MNQNKVKKIVIVLLILFILIGVVEFITFQNLEKKTNPVEQKEEEKSLEQPKTVSYSCTTKKQKIFLEEERFSYQYQEEYSFGINQDHSMYPIHYIKTIYFEKLDDLNKYYEKEISLRQNQSTFEFQKNEKELTIVESGNVLFGDTKKFSEEYIHTLSSFGYLCQKGE